MVACSLVLFYIMRDKDEIRIKKEQKAWMKAEIERRKNEGRAS
jgi:hypothetical protein